VPWESDIAAQYVITGNRWRPQCPWWLSLLGIKSVYVQIRLRRHQVLLSVIFLP